VDSANVTDEQIAVDGLHRSVAQVDALHTAPSVTDAPHYTASPDARGVPQPTREAKSVLVTDAHAIQPPPSLMHPTIQRLQMLGGYLSRRERLSVCFSF
jgi:hypothetical protein